MELMMYGISLGLIINSNYLIIIITTIITITIIAHLKVKGNLIMI